MLEFKLVSSIAVIAVLGMAAEKSTFEVKPVDQYANKQTTDGVTIAAEPYTTDEQAKTAFDKVNPWRYNILPVLVVLRNNTPNAVRLENLHFQYELPDRSKVDAMPAADVKYMQPGKRKVGVTPLGGIRISQAKGPLNIPAIETRAFSAKMLPAGDTASGFVYFDTEIESEGASLYITGLQNAVTGKELYYFEIPLSGR